MRSPLLLLLAAIACALPARAAEPGTPPRSDLDALLARADDAYRLREEPGKLEEVKATLAAAEKLAPGDYGVLWRLARLDFWLSDDAALSNDRKSDLGKRAWELGDRATAVNPGGVEGWFFAAVGMGNYSLGIGVVKALAQGIEGKFKERLSAAEKIDPGFMGGAIENAWGRFYYKLPWPKYDGAQSERHLRKALKQNPHNVRARLYLAELYEKEDHPKEARKLLEQAVAEQPGHYDAPEERRAQALARAALARMK
ncbi:MAG TPA: tetratricopeptide repeat protein [Anaeromyxobacteraceae bacterium]|jgi:tetratricopeptide (TPR) repeat protein|nr:tetratricopeptide repeat protein [Anaeromyxobacteraceae bacterium]